MISIQKNDLLITVYIFSIILSEVMGSKTFPIASIAGFPVTASVGIFLLPFVFTINSILMEVYGRARAQSVIACGFLSIIGVIVCSSVFTGIPPSARFLPRESAYDLVFESSIRISVASICAAALAFTLDVYVFSALRRRLSGYGLWFRNNAATFLATGVDTAVFVTLAFYDTSRIFSDNAPFLLGIILPYWGLKCIFSVVETPLVYAGVRWIRG